MVCEDHAPLFPLHYYGSIDWLLQFLQPIRNFALCANYLAAFFALAELLFS